MYDNFPIFESPSNETERLRRVIVEFQILFDNQTHLRKVRLDLGVWVLRLTFKLLAKSHGLLAQQVEPETLELHRYIIFNRQFLADAIRRQMLFNFQRGRLYDLQAGLLKLLRQV